MGRVLFGPSAAPLRLGLHTGELVSLTVSGVARQLLAVKRAARFWLYRRAEPDVVARFHKLYYQARERGITWGDTYWLGTQVLKCPFDLWVYQEILFSARPGLIIETGTYKGVSALFLACICDLIGTGHVVSVDIAFRDGRPEHSRITYLTGSSTSS